MQIVNVTDPAPLPVGVYNAINAVYPGFSFTSTLTNETTIWEGSSTEAAGLADFSFSVVPVCILSCSDYSRYTAGIMRTLLRILRNGYLTAQGVHCCRFSLWPRRNCQ